MKRETALRGALLASMLYVAAPAAAETPPPLSVYGELPGVEAMSISPDGGDLAIVARLAGERQLVILDPERRITSRAALADTRCAAYAG